jgi:hypothetical protein
VRVFRTSYSMNIGRFIPRRLSSADATLPWLRVRFGGLIVGTFIAAVVSFASCSGEA